MPARGVMISDYLHMPHTYSYPSEVNNNNHNIMKNEIYL